MVDVPNLPGVPPLPSYAPNTAQLLSGDAVSAIESALPSSWGIYVSLQSNLSSVQALSGLFSGPFGVGATLPLFLPATSLTGALAPSLTAFSQVAALLGLPNLLPAPVSLVDFEYAADSPISTAPQEGGAFQSYDKVQMPFDVKVRLSCSGSPSQRQSFLQALEQLRTTTVLVSVVTPEKTFANCNCTHYSQRRASDRGATMIVADVWFEQVMPAQAPTFSSTQQAATSGQQSLGPVQPQDASSSTVSAVQTGMN